MHSKIKTKHSARGAKINCINFHPCPLCYGCRNYDSKYIECQKCSSENQKYNICKVNFHTADKLAKMLKLTSL